MASDLNSITLIGRLTADPQLKYLPTGSAVVEFSVANNYFVPNKDKEVNYFDIVAFGKLAETVSKFLSKGKQIAITGTLRQDRWQDKESGSARSRIRIMMQNMQILTPKDGYNADNYSSTYEQPSAPSNVDIGSFSDEDEVPF